MAEDEVVGLNALKWARFIISGDPYDEDDGYSCNRFWTAENGVQEY